MMGYGLMGNKMGMELFMIKMVLLLNKGSGNQAIILVLIDLVKQELIQIQLTINHIVPHLTKVSDNNIASTIRILIIIICRQSYHITVLKMNNK